MKIGEVIRIPFYSIPKGNSISCKGWPQEAIMHMLLNNAKKAAGDLKDLEKTIEALKGLECDETLLIQSGKPIGIFKTHQMAPRVLTSNAMLVPMWATEENYKKLEAKGLTMYDRMAAGNWLGPGSLGMFYEALEVLGAVAKKYFDGTLKGRLVLSAGLGAMGRALPLAVTAKGGVALVVEADGEIIQECVNEKYCDTLCHHPHEAFQIATEARSKGRAVSVGLVGNAAQIYPALLDYGVLPDVVTDLTSPRDPLGGCVPAGMNPVQAIAKKKSIVAQVSAMLEMQKKGAVVFEYGNNLRRAALNAGLENAFDIPGYAPLFIRDLTCEGKGPLRWAAPSGDAMDIYKTEEKLLELFPDNENLKGWINLSRKQPSSRGLPSRECWLGYGERIKFGLTINEMVRQGLLSTPILIGRDYYNTGCAASPYGETEAMKDGSDTIADWPVLNALLNTASGAAWVSISHGNGVGIGYSIHTCMAVVADGTDEANRRIETVLRNDPGVGIIRHADAGYENAVETAKNNSIKIIM